MGGSARCKYPAIRSPYAPVSIIGPNPEHIVCSDQVYLVNDDDRGERHRCHTPSLTKLLVTRNADPDGDAKAPTWSRDSRRHAEEVTGVSQRMMLGEPVQADKCINR